MCSSDICSCLKNNISFGFSQEIGRSLRSLFQQAANVVALALGAEKLVESRCALASHSLQSGFNVLLFIEFNERLETAKLIKLVKENVLLIALLRFELQLIKLLHDEAINGVNVFEGWFVLDGDHEAHPLAESLRIRNDVLLEERGDEFSVRVLVGDIQSFQRFSDHRLDHVLLLLQDLIQSWVIASHNIDHAGVKGLANSVDDAVQEVVELFRQCLSALSVLDISELLGASLAPNQKDEHDRTLIWCLDSLAKGFLELDQVLGVANDINWNLLQDGLSDILGESDNFLIELNALHLILLNVKSVFKSSPAEHWRSGKFHQFINLLVSTVALASLFSIGAFVKRTNHISVFALIKHIKYRILRFHFFLKKFYQTSYMKDKKNTF